MDNVISPISKILDWAILYPEAAFTIAWGVYSLFAKLVLATTNTPDPETVRGKFYKALEISALIFGKVKDKGK